MKIEMGREFVVHKTKRNTSYNYQMLLMLSVFMVLVNEMIDEYQTGRKCRNNYVKSLSYTARSTREKK